MISSISTFSGISLISSGLLIALLFNVIAYKHAYSMLNFRPSGSRTKGIESLTLVEKLLVLFNGIVLPKPQNDERPEDYGLPYEIHKIESDTLRLEAWYIPAEKPNGTVLLFHGYGGSKSGVLGEAQAFHEMGYNTFLVDFRGCGGSEGSLTTIGFLEGNDVAASFDYVRTLGYQAQNQPLYLYGRSMGAASILRALATTDVQPDAIILDAVFAEMVTAVKNRFRCIGLPSVPAAHVLIFWASIQNGFSGFRHNPVKYASTVTVPTLVMHGVADQLATLDEGERVFNAICASRKRFIPFENLGHEPYLPAQPERWLGAVQAFLAT